MKKRTYIILSAILTLLLMSIVFGLSNNKMISDCKKQASLQRSTEYKTCINNYKDCRTNCSQDKKTCLNQVKQNYTECKNNCSDRECQRTCSNQYRLEKKTCSKSECLSNCRNQSNTCKEEAKNNYTETRLGCELTFVNVGQEECETAGGFYYEICNGPYFDIICSPQKFCICDGDNNYTCPQNYICNHKINSLLPRKQHTIQGYKDLLGKSLGDIGVCEEEKAL